MVFSCDIQCIEKLHSKRVNKENIMFFGYSLLIMLFFLWYFGNANVDILTYNTL